MSKETTTTLRVIDGAKASKGGDWITEEQYLGFSRGKPRIFRTQKSNLKWQFAMWVSEENKYFQKSLRTEIKKEALLLAEDEYLSVLNTIKEGRKPVRVSLEKLIDLFLIYQQERVLKKLIKQERYVVIKSRMAIAKAFVGKKKRLSQLSAEEWLAYTDWRREKGVQIQTIRQERSEINNLFKYALREGYINPHQIPRFDEMPRVSTAKRDAFEISEYSLFYRTIRKFIKEREKVGDDKRAFLWKLFYEWFLVCGNSGIRFAETRRIRWRDVRRAYRLKGDNAPKNIIVEIFLPAEITKTSRERLVIATAGEYITRLKKLWGGNPNPDDFVFGNPKDPSKALDKKQFYDMWHKVMKECGLNKRTPKLSVYSLRHFYATIRLLNKVDIYDLSKTMGCSVSYIEQHYSHVLTSQIAGRITKIDMDKDEREHIPL